MGQLELTHASVKSKLFFDNVELVNHYFENQPFYVTSSLQRSGMLGQLQKKLQNDTNSVPATAISHNQLNFLSQLGLAGNLV